MGEDKTSFWTDIKQFEAVLERDPDSYAFIPLSDLYRRLGLFDDALAVAERGCSRHPGLVAGQLVLGLACHELGMKNECRAALENVVGITPENVEAQRILSRMYADAGEHGAAEPALRIILSLAPNDLESRVILDAISSAGDVGGRVAAPELMVADDAGVSGLGENVTVSSYAQYPSETELDETALSREEATPSDFGLEADEDEILDLDDASIIEDLDDIAEETSELGQHEVVPDQAPLVSATMAELYVKQGFTDLAIGVYRQLVAEHPMDTGLLTRLDQLLTEERTAHHVSPALMPDRSDFDVLQPAGTSSAGEALTEPSPCRQDTLAVLDRWLENIRRVKACRSSLH